MVIVLGALILIVPVSFGLRLVVDVPNLAAGAVPDDPTSAATSNTRGGPTCTSCPG